MTGAGGLLCRRPTVDEVEQRQRPQERQPPQLLKAVDYQLKFEAAINTGRCQLTTRFTGGERYPQRTPLQLTLGVNDNSVES